MSRRNQGSEQRGRHWLTLEPMSVCSVLRLSSFTIVSRIVRSIGSSTGSGSLFSYDATMEDVDAKVESMTVAMSRASGNEVIGAGGAAGRRGGRRWRVG